MRTGIVQLPDIEPFAGRLARRWGCRHILLLGCDHAVNWLRSGEEFNIIGVDSADEIERCRSQFGRGTWIAADLAKLDGDPVPPAMLQESIVVCTGITDRLPDRWLLGPFLHRLLEHAPAAILTGGAAPASARDALARLLADCRASALQIAFSGFTSNDSVAGEKAVPIVLLQKNAFPPISSAPPRSKVVAIMAAFNEADILAGTIRHLHGEGVDIYLIDNWSTDGTYELALSMRELLVGLERWPPAGPSPLFNFRDLLLRKAEIAQSLQADWFLHYDVDEIRQSPWPGVSLQRAISYVDILGFNAIDFTLLEFPPIDNAFLPGFPLQDHFHYFQFPPHPSFYAKVTAWKKTGTQVDLASSAGHDVRFPGRKVFPFNFLARHYPIRSQAHGERKLLRERRPRYDPALKELGWHTHYDHLTAGSRYLRRPEDLLPFDAAFQTHFLLERLSDLGFLRRPALATEAAEGALHPQPEPALGADTASPNPWAQLNAVREELATVSRDLTQRTNQLNVVLAELRARTAFLEEILASHAWRLIERLRRLRVTLAPPGSAGERLWFGVLDLLGGGRTRSQAHRGTYAPAPAMKDRMFRQIVWMSDRLRIGDAELFLEPFGTDRRNDTDRLVVYKSKPMVERYERFFRSIPEFQPAAMLELGLWDGGSVVFWNEILHPRKIVGLDISDRTDKLSFREYVRSHGLEGRVITYWQTDQADKQRLRQIAESEFRNQLDLVIDDCSHIYGPARASFEALFPLLVPGGWYILEDWDWAHQPEAVRKKIPFADQRSPTDLVVELVKLVGSCPGAFPQLLIESHFVAVQRGPQPLGGPEGLHLEALFVGEPLPPQRTPTKAENAGPTPQAADERALQLEAQLEQALALVGEYQRSRAWKLIEALRRFRVRLAPPGSARERLWFAALDLFRGRPPS